MMDCVLKRETKTLASLCCFEPECFATAAELGVGELSADRNALEFKHCVKPRANALPHLTHQLYSVSLWLCRVAKTAADVWLHKVNKNDVEEACTGLRASHRQEMS